MNDNRWSNRFSVYITLGFLIALGVYVFSLVRVFGPYEDRKISIQDVLEFSKGDSEDELDFETWVKEMDFKSVSEWPKRKDVGKRALYWFRLDVADLGLDRGIPNGLIELREGGRYWSMHSMRLYIKSGSSFRLVSRIANAEGSNSHDVGKSGFALAFSLSLAEIDDAELYIRVIARENFAPNFKLWPEEDWRQQFQFKSDMFFILRLGMLITVVSLVGIFGFRLKMRLLWYYFGYMVFLCLVLVNTWQVHSDNWFFWPKGSFWSFAWVSLLGVTIQYSFLLAFTRLFLDLKKRGLLVRLTYYLDIGSWLTIACVYVISKYDLNGISLNLLAFRSILFSAVLLGIGVVRLKEGRRDALFYILSFASILIGYSLDSLVRLEQVPEWPYPFSELSIADMGVVAGAFLLAIAAGDRLLAIQFERDTAVQESLGNLERLRSVEEGARKNLEAKVDERTRELQVEVERSRNAEIALEVALSDSEKANQSKSVFLASMSHELRTPLNAIIGYAQLMSKRDYPLAKIKSSVSVMLKSGEHLLELINDVLSLSKIEAGRVELDAESFNVSELLRELVQMLGVNAEQKDVSIRLEEGVGLGPTVSGDRRLLRQILINLIGNAIKFTDRGGIEICVNRSKSDERALVFEIRDTGVGIPQAEFDRVFEPFSQVGSREKQIKGTGLGLSISRKLSRSMGGDILLDSTIGEGSTFTVTVPLPQVEDQTPTKIIGNEDRYAKVVGYSGERREVLVVDDELLNREVARDFFEAFGFNVFEAENGMSALECMKERNYNFVLLDMVMPGMSGAEVVRAIRGSEKQSEIPIVVLSASVLEEDRKACNEAGADAFLEKPMKQEAMVRVLSEVADIPWVFEKEAEASIAEQAECSVLPPKALLAQLGEHASSGYVRGVKDVVSSLKNDNVDYSVFISKIENYLLEFDLESIVKLVDTVEGN